MGLGDRIAEAIAGSRKTKAQVARECDVTSGAVSQWLSGETKSLKAETALALENATGYRAYWILHGKGPKTLAEPVNVWPFPKVNMERFVLLDERDQGYVERRLIQAIEECENFLNPSHVPHLGAAFAAGENVDATRGSATTTLRKGNTPLSAHPVQTESPLEEAGALSKVLERTEGKSRERSKNAGVQKSRAGRRT